ncbi:MAG: PepSY domain-containing protein [Betaproteobacteria bacterium]|jgi:uncharacterized membrane protein YkoI|nr:PepSY domain-containing protein [Rhodocyclaceae bacterium]MCA3134284.1 PepSY domain-containing protein [Rhodocyclaceae bacterium]MCA3142119.1 PepSY domain-containing protein [Rhodocyclaceae bacterium]MCA3146824.1 PepSY domain-containing protein [Rhodocyclaceae bacterium]MCE2896598.1 PepSY domain-containing protein [Betaproteobacteria bacterium]
MKALPLAAILSVACLPAFGQTLDIPKTKVSMEQCLQAVLAKYPAKVKSVELEIERGTPYYEFEITTLLDGHTWEAECNANTGAISKVERDVKPDDPAFAKVARISAAEAMKIALAKVPGQPKEIEYEVAPDGRAWYEFTIVGKGGATTEVMVDAATGEVIGTEDETDEQEIYRIGGDDD